MDRRCDNCREPLDFYWNKPEKRDGKISPTAFWRCSKCGSMRTATQTEMQQEYENEQQAFDRG